MSLGGSSQKSSSQSQATSQQAIDPGILSTVNANLQRAQAVAGAPTQQYGGLLAAPLDPNIGAASSAAQNLTGYQAPQVQSGLLKNTDLSPYMNPFQQNVIDATNNDLARQKAIGDTAAAGQATASGAFGGSRSAVLQNLNDDSYTRAMATTDANLRQQGFTQAQGAAATDIGNTNQASLANQQASLAGAGVQTGAAGLLGQLGQFGTQNAMAGLQAAYQEWLRQQNDPLVKQQLLNQSVGLLPNPVLSSSQSTGTSKGTGTSFSASLPPPPA